MSRALTVITQNRPYQTFRVGYDMQVSPLVAGERDQELHYAEIRARLMRPAPKQKPRLMLAPPAAPVAVDDGCPLNMLALPSPRFLIALAALRGGVTTDQILSPSRVNAVCAARHEAVALVYSHGYRSLPTIGRIFKRHHTSILHSVRKLGANPLPPEPGIETPVFIKKASPGRPPVMREVRGAGRAPTPLQLAVRHAYYNDIPASVLADELGCSPRSVKIIAWRMGLTRNPRASRAKRVGKA